jgi:hypothetical protein
MAEAEGISARKATLLNPTKDDETVQVLLRRLFGKIDLRKPRRPSKPIARFGWPTKSAAPGRELSEDHRSLSRQLN